MAKAESEKTEAGGKLRPLVDPKLVSALAHPLRIHILDALGEAPASPSDLARQVGLSVNYVAYHVKELEKIGYVELIRTEPRRGTVEHYYSLKRRCLIDDDEWELLPEAIRDAFNVTILRSIVDEATEALGAGTFATRANHMSRTKLLVDEQGWEDLHAALAEMLDRVLGIQADCAERLGKVDEEGIPTAVAMASFETPPRG